MSDADKVFSLESVAVLQGMMGMAAQMMTVTQDYAMN